MRTDVNQQSASVWALFPREHGGYAELAFPLLTGLALGNFNLAQLFLVFAAVALFLAHESILIMTGERGSRALSQLRQRAKVTALILCLLAIIMGTAGLWISPPGARWSVLPPLGLGALLIPLIVSHREKTLLGELLIALTFSMALIPVALAGGVSAHSGFIGTGVWFTVFALETLTVRAVKANVKNDTKFAQPSRTIIVAGLAVVVAAFSFALTDALPILPAVAVLPAALVALGCGLLKIHPRHLRGLGWSLVACDLAALAVLLIGLRQVL